MAMYISTEISPEAQEFLRSTTPWVDQPTTPQQWKEARKNFNDFFQDQSEQAKGRWIASAKEVEIAGVPATIVTPNFLREECSGKMLFYIHGGGYTYGNVDCFYGLLGPILNSLGLKTCSVEYRLAPEHPFPAGLDDCLAVYKELLSRHAPSDIVMLGDSAGGGLTAATLLKARSEGLPMPAAIALLSPWVDITKTGDSYYNLEGISPILHYEKNLRKQAEAYAGGRHPKDPLISPVYGTFEGFPPTLITTGGRDLLVSDSVRLYRRMREARVDVHLDLWDGLWHVFQITGIPEAKQSCSEIADFLISNSRK